MPGARGYGANGLSLVELLVVLALAATLWGLAAPPFARLLEAQEADVVIRRVAAAVHATRAFAVLRGEPMDLCPGRPSEGCRGDWADGMFIVPQAARRAGAPIPDEQALRVFAPLPEGARLSWRAFRNRGFLRMVPRGHTQWQNGRFTYCPPSREPAHVQALVVNVQGRARLVHDTDGDGVIEDRRGRPARCR